MVIRCLRSMSEAWNTWICTHNITCVVEARYEARCCHFMHEFTLHEMTWISNIVYVYLCELNAWKCLWLHDISYAYGLRNDLHRRYPYWALPHHIWGYISGTGRASADGPHLGSFWGRSQNVAFILSCLVPFHLLLAGIFCKTNIVYYFVLKACNWNFMDVYSVGNEYMLYDDDGNELTFKVYYAWILMLDLGKIIIILYAWIVR